MRLPGLTVFILSFLRLFCNPSAQKEAARSARTASLSIRSKLPVQDLADLRDPGDAQEDERARQKDGELADANGNGIPDWAETLGYNTADAYLRALAEGLLPDGSTNPAFKDLTDLKFDGVKDWWQKMYGLTGSAQEDTDKDGLADFA